MISAIDTRRRHWALLTLCMGSLLITIDTSIVNVALPAIRADLAFSEESLIWVVNAYLTTFGGFLLLGGRLGDVFGHRRMFLLGVALFTCASLVCGLAGSKEMLVSARAVQGFGGAIVCVLTVPLLLGLFKEAPDRARALGTYAFVCAAGGSLGLMFGGTITRALGWHWVFLVNVPLGPTVYVLSSAFLPKDTDVRTSDQLDAIGAITVTTSVFLALYVIINGNHAGWYSAGTLLGLSSSALLMGLFVAMQSRARTPLMPLALLRTRDLLIANIVTVMTSAAAFGWFFIYARFLQSVLHYDPLDVALAYLPSNVAVAVVSIVVSPRLIGRFGIRPPLVAGQLMSAAGLAILAGTPLSTSPLVTVLCGMLLMGVGTGTTNAPLLLAAMTKVGPKESGVASGIVRTTSVMGGAIGLSILGSISSAHTERLLTAGAELRLALQGGYHAALYLSAGVLVLGAMLSVSLAPSVPGVTTSGAH